MPPFADQLSDADIANIVNYERSSWGNHAKPATAADVAAVRAKGPRAGDRHASCFSRAVLGQRRHHRDRRRDHIGCFVAMFWMIFRPGEKHPHHAKYKILGKER